MNKTIVLAAMAILSIATAPETSAGPYHRYSRRCYPVPPAEGPQWGGPQGGTWLQALANQVGQLRREVVTLQTQVATLRSEVDALQKRREALRREIQAASKTPSIWRNWTDETGMRTANAKLVRVENDVAYFERDNGVSCVAPVAGLSIIDRQWIRTWQASRDAIGRTALR